MFKYLAMKSRTEMGSYNAVADTSADRIEINKARKSPQKLNENRKEKGSLIDKSSSGTRSHMHLSKKEPILK